MRTPATRKRRRLYAVLAGLTMLGIAAALVLTAFQDNIVFFYSPSDLTEKELRPGQNIRLGGLVEEGSVKKAADGVTTEFVITDLSKTVPVRYGGLLPDLFREGQGVVSQGTLGPDGVFVASEVLAKHDEKYMPPEVADALKRSGQWKEPTK
ncbi:MAG: cytochrome c maturation protein CcmE [Alphaproteobacteria bacterium]|nr:cytochrome c maturation protein CcmE [Alphaproteobacteria bacterium]